MPPKYLWIPSEATLVVVSNMNFITPIYWDTCTTITMVYDTYNDSWLVVSNMIFFHFIYGIIVRIDELIFFKMVFFNHQPVLISQLEEGGTCNLCGFSKLAEPKNPIDKS